MWICVVGLLGAVVLTVGTWKSDVPFEPEGLVWWAFYVSLLVLAVTVFWVWFRHVRPGRWDVPSLIEGIPPIVSVPSVLIFLVAVALYAVASLQYQPGQEGITGSLEIRDGQYVRVIHGTAVPTTREDYIRSLVQAERTYTTGTVAACAVALMVAAAGRGASRRAR
jgi:hypothetical protein